MTVIRKLIEAVANGELRPSQVSGSEEQLLAKARTFLDRSGKRIVTDSEIQLDIENHSKRLSHYLDPESKLQFLISWDDFTADTLRLTQMILDRHPDVSGIAGCPRSGLRAACDVALRLGVPLYEASPNELRYVGGGSRIRAPQIHGERKSFDGPIVIVDDSTCSGTAISEIKGIPEAKDLPAYVVYAASPGRYSIDGYARHLELPHWFEWNLWGNGSVIRESNMSIDFDGVLCDDCSFKDDDDGERYVRWMQNVKPIRTPRDFTVPRIVTARREAYRKITEQWLQRYRINYGELIMFPGTFEQRSKTCIGSWKAREAVSRSSLMFVESSLHQARIILANMPEAHRVVSIERPPGR